MPKIQLKGKVSAVYAQETVGTGDKTLQKQTFIFLVPSWKDGFGDIKGKDEFWEIDVIGEDNIKKFALSTDMEGENAIVDLYINSNTIPAKPAAGTEAAKPERRIINANLATFALHTSGGVRA